MSPGGMDGKESAAIVATSLLSTYPSVRYGMMVGVGGGVPSDVNDIRLGDIVVCKPGPDNGGVVQYDYGKTIEKGVFTPTGTLNLPPLGLLTAMTQVQAYHNLSRFAYIEHLSGLPTNLDPRFSRPEKDVQFLAEYDHVRKAPTCAQCSTKKMKKLSARKSMAPRVFYGTIASGDEVMRHGRTRDRIASQSGALCFEMEAAGIVNKFPCLVIRGICDYADSHKNKEWQPYAALAAAAYAKELLAEVAPEDMVKEVPIVSRLGERSDGSNPTALSAENSSHHQSRSHRSSEPSSDYNGEANLGFYTVLNKRVLHSTTVTLGRLVLEIDAPWDNYCASNQAPRDSQIGISLQFRFQDILKGSEPSSSEYQRLACRLAMLLQTKDPQQAFDSVSEKTYILPNASTWLKDACAEPATRKWLEKTINTDEIVAAIRYQKVAFNWLWGWSSSVDAATLEREPQIWKALFIARGSNKANAIEQEEFLELGLVDAAEAFDVSDKQILHIGGSEFVL